MAGSGTRSFVGVRPSQRIADNQVGAPQLRLLAIAAPPAPGATATVDAGAVTGASIVYYARYLVKGLGRTVWSAGSTAVEDVDAKTVDVTVQDSAETLVWAIEVGRAIDAGAIATVGYLWANADATFTDDVAPGSEDTTAPNEDQTAANWGLAFERPEPGSDGDRADSQIVSGELTGSIFEPRSMPGQVKYDNPLALAARAGHQVLYEASMFGAPTVTQVAGQPVWQYTWGVNEISDEPEDAVSFDLLVYKGGGSRLKPQFIYGNRCGEIDYSAGENKEVVAKMKLMGSGDSECSPGIPAGGNSGTYKFHPVSKGTRGDASSTDAYALSVYAKFVNAPGTGIRQVKFRRGTAATFGGAYGGSDTIVNVHYDATSKRQIQYGAQQSAWVEAIDQDGLLIGFDVNENRQPFLVYFPGDLTLYANNDEFEFQATCPIPGPGSAPYTGKLRLFRSEPRFGPAHISLFSLDGADNPTRINFENGSYKIGRKLDPVHFLGEEARTPIDVDLSGKLMLQIEVQKRYEDRFWERLMKRDERLKVRLLNQGPRIVIQRVPTVTLSTHRVGIDRTLNSCRVNAVSAPIANDGVLKQKVQFVVEEPEDGSSGMDLAIKSSIPFDFASI